MKDQFSSLLIALNKNDISFKEVIEFIETYYTHQATAFKNGETYNEASQNQGSARVFAFAKMNNLSKEATLSLFAEHYKSVLATPDGLDHQNIRQFMIYGWDGVIFEGEALSLK